MISTKSFAGVLIFTVASCLSAARAQQTQQGDPSGRPAVPVRPIPSGAAGQPQQSSDRQASVEPASPILVLPAVITGALSPSVEVPSDTHSALVFGIQVSETVDTNSLLTGGSSGSESVTSVAGQFGLRRIRANTEFQAQYAGGGLFYAQQRSLNTSFHQFGVTQKFDFRRWSFLFSDQFGFLPESQAALSSGGLSGFSTAGGQLPNIQLPNQQFSQNQSILTPYSKRISNSAVAQVMYLVNSRSALTVTGGLSFLHFVDPGFLDPYSPTFEVGYNRSISSRDTISVDYHLNMFRFRHSPTAINDHVVGLTYSHRLSESLFLTVGGGPELYVMGQTPTTPASTHAYWSFNSSLERQGRYVDLSIAYNHGVSGGGGVLDGSQGDGVVVNASHQLSRRWFAAGNFGFGMNRSLPGTNAAQTPITYRSWFSGGTLSRQMGRYSSVSFQYAMQRQGQSNLSCSGPSCTGNFTRHQITIGLNWQMRPILLD